MAVPFVNYIFLPLFSFFVILILYHFLKSDKSIFIKKYIQFNFQILFLSFFLFFAFMISTHNSFFNFKEILYSIVILVLSFGLFFFIKNKDQFIEFMKYFCIQIIIAASLVSIFGLINIYLKLKGYDFQFVNYIGSSLTSDNNFYALFSFIGIISILFGLIYFSNNRTFNHNFTFSFLLLILSINIFFSYSRRGIILLMAITLISIIILIVRYQTKDKLYRVLFLYILSFLSFILLFILFIFMPTQFKRNILSKSKITAKSYQDFSASLLNKYSSIFSDQDYNYFRKIVWNEEPDPRNPDPGWNSTKCTLVFPLVGENVEIVPENSIGYKMDSTANAATWANNAYSFTDISEFFREDTIDLKSKLLIASVYCFVSQDFDGGYARISAEGEAVGEIFKEYDLNNKGIWQKLQIKFKTTGGIPPVYLFWSKNGVKNFKRLNGYVIFAFPDYTSNSTKRMVELSTFRKTKVNRSIIEFSFFPIEMVSKIFSGIEFPSSQDSISQYQNNKFLRELENNNFSGPRTSRWYYSWMLFNEYPIQKKIFGGGFDYHEKFGAKFGETKYDYPHNPFLSAFLYSGIIGGLTYIWYMFLVFYYYIKYYRYHIYFFICFLVTFYFSFFSANTHFSVPIYAILSIIPFLTKYIVENEKRN